MNMDASQQVNGLDGLKLKKNEPSKVGSRFVISALRCRVPAPSASFMQYYEMSKMYRDRDTDERAQFGALERPLCTLADREQQQQRLVKPEAVY